MTAANLARSAITDSEPPAGLSPALSALWLAKAGRWDEAHELCQKVPGRDGAWIHAWLHREEGDQSNADYWYAKAGKPPQPRGKSLEEEWEEIVSAIGRL